MRGREARRIAATCGVFLLTAWLGACDHGASDTRGAGDARVSPDEDATTGAEADAHEDPSDAAVDADAGEPPYAGPTRWTVLVFLAADNNLEGSAIDDMREMLAANLPSNVRVLIEVDRAPGFYELGVGGVPAWETVKRFEVRDHALIEAADLGEINTGDPAALSDFVRWGFKAYPSERKVLVLWNHGNAWRGWGSDDTQNHDLLDDDEIARGIREGMQAAGVSQLDLLGFDACLMSSLETAHMAAAFSRYLIASEELEPAHGWDYTKVLSAIGDAPDQSIPDLGAAIVRAYAEQARSQNKHRVVTLNTLDLSGLKNLDTAVDALLDKLNTQLDARKADIAFALNHAQRFGDHPDPSRSFHMVDLGDFAKQLATRDPALAQYSDPVQSALRAMVLSSYYGTERKGASGLSVYFPERHTNYLSAFDAVAGAMAWRGLLGGFHDLVTHPSEPVPQLSGHGAHHDTQADPEIHERTAEDTFINAHDFGSATPTCKAGQGPEISASVSPEDAKRVADAWLLAGLEQSAKGNVDVFVRKHARVAPDGKLDETWDRHLLVAVQGQHQRILFAEVKLASDNPRYALATVPLLYTPEGPADLDHPGKRCPCAQPGEPGYSDLDADGHPDCGDVDVDADGVPDKLLDETLRCPHKDEEGCPPAPALDNCPYTPNSDQKDADGDRVGDACDDGKMHVPHLACRPAPTGPLTHASAAWWQVTVDRQDEEEVEVSLYVAGPDGASEAKPGPEAVLWLDVPHVGPHGQLVWDDEVPLPFSFGQPIHFRYEELTDVVLLNAAGDPALDAAGHAQSLTQKLGYDEVYLELEVEDYAGRSDAAAVVEQVTDCIPCHDLASLAEELSSASKPLCYDACPAANDEPDCAGACIDTHLRVANGHCDDGTGGKPNLNCKRFDFDHRECAAPPCPDGFLRDCHGECTESAHPTSHKPLLGDGSCNAAFDCAELSYDAGDCACAHGCGGHGSCASDGKRCECAAGFAGAECELALPACGDQRCDVMQNETCSTCAADCGACAKECGNGTCQHSAGESCETCAQDCGTCRCGDGECSVDEADLAQGESCRSCPSDCGACPVCGDLRCDGYREGAPFTAFEAESCGTCPGDCGDCVGDCCLPDATVGEAFVGGGCGDETVSMCVCHAHPECCRSGWNAACVSYAQVSCSLACAQCDEAVGDDIDADGVCGYADNCPFLANPGQEDGDQDGAGDLCDRAPADKLVR